jgi:hypothetical protein
MERGPDTGIHEAVQKALDRARKRETQLISVRELLRLLERYGAGPAPQVGTLFRSDYDPLEHLLNDPSIST